MTAWRRDLHAHPELALEENRTSAFVQDRLREFGVDEIVTGLAKTGVVGVIRGRGGSDRAVGLRADMDALPHSRAIEPTPCLAEPRRHACLRP